MLLPKPFFRWAQTRGRSYKQNSSVVLTIGTAKIGHVTDLMGHFQRKVKFYAETLFIGSGSTSRRIFINEALSGNYAQSSGSFIVFNISELSQFVRLGSNELELEIIAIVVR